MTALRIKMFAGAAIVIAGISLFSAFAEAPGGEAVITRINTFTAQPGQAETVKQTLAEAVQPIENAHGYISHEILSAVDMQETIIVIEKWSSVEDHQVAAAAISPDDIQALMSMLAQPPSGDYYQE